MCVVMFVRVNRRRLQRSPPPKFHLTLASRKLPSMANETLPRDARLIALMLASSPAITDAQPAVLQMLLEVAHRTPLSLESLPF